MSDSYFTGDRQFWGDPDFETEHQIVVYAMLWQSSTTDIAGIHRRNDDIDSIWCRLEKGVYLDTLTELQKMGKVGIYDRHIWVKPGLWYNLYQGRYSIKQIEAVVKRLKLTPNARLVADLIGYYRDKYDVRIPYAMGTDTPPNGYCSESVSESETDTESNTESEEKKPRPAKELEDEVIRRLVLLYLRTCKSLPGLYRFDPENDQIDISKLGEARRRHLLARWREHPTMDWWQQYFERIEASDFLTGRSKRGDGHENWIADFDFILKPTKRDSIMEGKYDNDREKRTQGHPRASGPITI